MMDFFQNRSSNYVVRRRKQVDGAAGPSSTASTLKLNASEPVSSASPPSPPSTESGRDSPEAYTAEKNGNGISCSIEPAVDRSMLREPTASGHGNWVALPFKESRVGAQLGRRFGVTSIPKLVVVSNEDGCAITREGKMMVLRDPDAKGFPWRFAESQVHRDFFWRHIAFLVFLVLLSLYYVLYF